MLKIIIVIVIVILFEFLDNIMFSSLNISILYIMLNSLVYEDSRTNFCL